MMMKIIVEFHNGKGHQCISHTVNMIRCYFWWVSMHRDVHQHINSCQLYIQFLPNWLYTLPMHLEIPKLPFAGYAMDCIGPLPATSKGNRHTLTFICLLMSYLIMVKQQMRYLWLILKKFYQKPHVLGLSYKTMVWNLKMTN